MRALALAAVVAALLLVGACSDEQPSAPASPSAKHRAFRSDSTAPPPPNNLNSTADRDSTGDSGGYLGSGT
jgi:hypothetical protein